MLPIWVNWHGALDFPRSVQNQQVQMRFTPVWSLNLVPPHKLEGQRHDFVSPLRSRGQGCIWKGLTAKNPATTASTQNPQLKKIIKKELLFLLPPLS